MKFRRLTLLLSAVGAVVAAGALLAARPAPDLPALREGLTLRINQERETAGVPPLAPSDVLHQVAQSRADELAARGELPGEAETLALLNRIQMRLVRAGYDAQGWTESIASTQGDPGAVIAYWKESGNLPEAMALDYRHVGVGIASLKGVPLYTFLFAWPKSDYFARQVAPLADLEQVRAAILAAVNAARQDGGRPPLRLEPRLNTAAQKHAEDMLARVYYSHKTPEGTMPWSRVQAAGYTPSIVGENIAAGHVRVDEVMDAWLHSSGHRRNILEGRFTEVGIGLAVGTYDHRYQLLWVQEFARPQ
ncbi:MAG TPA: CAP domain-containing protein [Thermoanaerobaculia bacterium]|nr:CAP domain-containing protein [Thermoanaerobaculia bacterium]